jgi:hypothetical protein
VEAKGTLVLYTLLAAMTPAYADASSSADSIPEPTELSVAIQTGATLLRTRAAGKIRSSDATAELSAIEVASQGDQPIRGLKISLRSLSATHELYLGEFELQHFRLELAELESQFADFHSHCEATGSCVTGVARCRPSQTEAQAFCPMIYTTSAFLKGFGLSTSRQSFLFPFVPPEKFLNAIDAAAKALD